jgi:hypothetical protein
MNARDAQDAKTQRAAARAGWPIRRFALGTEPGPDLSDTTTAEERIGMVWQLTLDAWAMSGQPLPDYPRHKSPGRVFRPPEND